jgi:hypothetical protein
VKDGGSIRKNSDGEMVKLEEMHSDNDDGLNFDQKLPE